MTTVSVTIDKNGVIQVAAPGPQGTTGPLGATGSTGPIGPAGPVAGYSIDFVLDCGADPTGATDCGPALATAYAKLSALAADPRLPLYNFALVVPPGVYNFDNPSTVAQTWNFSSKANRISILGTPGASIFRLALYGYTNLVAITGAAGVYIYGITHIGARNDTAGPDVDTVWLLFCQYSNFVERCDFHYLIAGRAGLYGEGHFAMRDCLISNCASLGNGTGGYGFIYYDGTDTVDIEGLQICDFTPFNGDSAGQPANKVGVNVRWLRTDGPMQHVRISRSFIDEGCAENIRIDGSANGTGSGRVRHVEMSGLRINPTIHQDAITTIALRNVDFADIRGLHVLSPSGASPATPALSMINCATVQVKKINVDSDNPLTGTIIEADASTSSVVLEDSNVPVDNTILACTRPVSIDLGTMSDVLSAGGSVVANQLVKMSAVGVVVAALTSDAVSDVRGPSLDISSNMHKLRVARPGQPVTVLSDGAGVLAVGDKVTLSGAQAGRVKKTTTGAALGCVLTGAAASLDATLTIQFLPQTV